MRIAYVCTDPGIPVFGRKGASVHIQEVLRVLVRRGAEVHLFCTRTGGQPPADLRTVRVVCTPLPATTSTLARELVAISAAAELAMHLRRAGPFDLIYERYALWGGIGVARARELEIPGVLEVNAPLLDEHARHRALVHVDAAQRHLRTALTDATTVSCVSTPVARWVHAAGGDPARTVVVPNGVDTTRFQPPSRPPASPFTVGFVGTLKPWHGVDHLVTAFARLPKRDSARLLLVGDGPCAAQLALRAERLGIAQLVELTGALDPAAVPAQLARCHVATAPYPPPTADTDYFSPLKLYEYMAAGVAVVASETGQAAEVITPEVNGVLVPPGDATELATALHTLRVEPERRARLGAAARATARAQHTWDAAVDATLGHAGVHLPAQSSLVA